MPPKEFQPGNTAFQTAIAPEATTAFTLSGGRERPFYYYLGVNSTVPFIRLESPVTQKELSWGDIVELPPGTNVNVRNISYHTGDVHIQSGIHPCMPPARISVPVACLLSVDAGTGILSAQPDFPCDTRRARRAYFSIAFPDLGNGTTASVTGTNKQHARNARTSTPEAYIDSFSFPTTIPTMIPLGTSIEGNAMRLCDIATIALAVSGGYTVIPSAFNGATFLDAFYVLEY